MKNKVIILDWSIFLFRSAFVFKKNPKMRPTFTAMSMIIGNLKKIGIDPDDIIIIACDGKGNWRKKFEPTYKENRPEQRKKSGIDFTKIFKDFNWLIKKVDEATNWHIIKLDLIEADDIASICCKYYKDKEIILVSYDSDWEQMWNYDNVKIFSPMTKRYKIKPPKFDVYTFISKKIQKEVSDNLVNPILSTKDFDKREKVINLLNLPEFVELSIKNILDNLKEKDLNIELLPFETIRNRFMDIYNGKDILTYEKCLKRQEKRKKKKKYE